MIAIVTYKTSAQISPDDWSVWTKAITVPSDTTIRDLADRLRDDFMHSENIDVELHILPNESEVDP